MDSCLNPIRAEQESYRGDQVIVPSRRRRETAALEWRSGRLGRPVGSRLSGCQARAGQPEKCSRPGSAYRGDIFNPRIEQDFCRYTKIRICNDCHDGGSPWGCGRQCRRSIGEAML